MFIYVVQPGDTVDRIAGTFQIPVSTLILINQLYAPYELAIGEALLIDDSIQTPCRPFLRTGGYAYPFINPEVLEEILPYLSELYCFSYGFSPNGDLIPPPVDDTFLITAAKAASTSPVLTLTPFGPDGQFNNALITQVVQNPAARENLKNNLIVQITERGFEGVDVDFEYILATDRDAFTAFVSYLEQELEVFGCPVSVALAPKTSANQTGLLYEGKDYAGLGAAADYCLLMTYEWGYTYGPPMAVAPINKVQQVVDYAITEIPVKKINLGIPNYGYDWSLPYEQGITKARTIGNAEAIQIAIAQNAIIQFDETAQSPFFNYYDSETQLEHEVWFEDVRSLQAKFDLIKNYELRGCSYWQIMRFFRPNWVLLTNQFRCP